MRKEEYISCILKMLERMDRSKVKRIFEFTQRLFL